MAKKTDKESRTAKPKPDAPGAKDDIKGRRGFLTKSGLLLAVLGAPAAALAQSPTPVLRGSIRLDRRQALSIENVVREAERSGNIAAALESHGRRLPTEVKTSLRQLSADDLRSIASLRQKLGSLETNLAADNNGVVIM